MRIITFTFLMIMSSWLWAETKIETIQLNHRLATEVLPEVQAFLPKGATARAFNEFIILKAEPTVIEEIKQLINQLDTALQRLKISVLKTDEILSEQQGSQDNATIVLSNDGFSGDVRVKRWSTDKATGGSQRYQAQGVAGRPILITMGQDIPQKEQYLLLTPYGGVAAQSNTYYLNIDNGFQAVARILPNHQVIIDIHPLFNQLNKRNGVIETTEAVSSISGPAGEWIMLGQIDNEKNIEKQGSTRYHTHRQQQQTIYIKVDNISP
ncbi:MAG: hypothetical protein HRT93_07450 [Piscirickettsiaceae bacterium]|nr:hypothetical protein [Piscirickettsiaceae bacterium]